MDWDSLERELETRLEAMGFELVELERAGSRTRPVLWLRIDVAAGDRGVTLDDCARVSRALEPYLDAREDLHERSVLDASSPAGRRPLGRAPDLDRFAGKEVAWTGYGPLAGRSRRLTGTLLGLAANGEERSRLRLEDGEE